MVDRVEQVVASLQANPAADVDSLRREIDDLIFDLFEIHGSRDEVRRFYETIGRVGADAADQAATA